MSAFVDPDMLVSVVALTDGGLPEEKRRAALSLIEEIPVRLREAYGDDFSGEFVLKTERIEYSGGEVSSLAPATLSALLPPTGEGRSRRVLLVFHGETCGEEDGVIEALSSILEGGALPQRETRVFLISDSEELIRRVDEACIVNLWSMPMSEICETTAEEIARIIYIGI